MPEPEYLDGADAVDLDDEEELEELGRRSGCRRVLNAILWFLLLVLLAALLWPVAKKDKKALPYEPPKFSVNSPKNLDLDPVRMAGLYLKRNYRNRFVVTEFDLVNEDRTIDSLSYDNFELVVKQGNLTKEIRPHSATERLQTEKRSPWGKAFTSGETIHVELLFQLAKEAEVRALRVFDADRRSSKYKEFKLYYPAETTVPVDRQ